MVFQVLVHIKCIQFLGIEACEEHAHDQKEVEWLHICTLFLHAKVDVVVVGTEVFRCETRPKHGVIIIHDGL